MLLELLKYATVQDGLKELRGKAHSMKQNMVARVKTPILEDGTDLWKTFLDSRTPNLYGALNQDNRHRFKIDNAFDLSKIIDEDINPDGSISTDEPMYSQSQGTEFIIIKRTDIDGAKADYAIRSDKYEHIKEQLSKGKYEGSELAKAGGFKANVQLKPDEIIKYKAKNIDELTWDDIEYVHDGLLEHAVGKNNASKDEYLEAAKLLAKYVVKAQEEGCFKEGTGIGFFVETDVDDYKLRPWYLHCSGGGSGANGRYDFDGDGGRFLRVAAQKIDYRFLASTLESLELDPKLLGNVLTPKSLKNIALAQAAYADKQQKP